MKALAKDAIRRQRAESDLKQKVDEDAGYRRNAMDRWGILVNKNEFPVISGVNIWLLSRFLGPEGLPSHKDIMQNYSISSVPCTCNLT